MDTGGSADHLSIRSLFPWIFPVLILLMQGFLSYLKEKSPGASAIFLILACYIPLRAKNDELKYHVRHDKLTGLYSRYFFCGQIDERIARNGPDGKLYLITADIHKFRMINDLYGIRVGDEILRQAAGRLSLFPEDLFCAARLDGNEFALFNRKSVDICEIRDHVGKLLKAFDRPFTVHHFQILLQINVGIAVYPDDAADRADLLTCAKTAVEQAKATGKNASAMYSSQIHASLREKQKIENALRHADMQREFSLAYQPQYDAAGRHLMGMESLLRWNSPLFGPAAPDLFIPIAEESGYILELAEWSMSESMKQIVRWNTEFGTDLRMSINISAIQLKNSDFCDRVEALIAETGVNPAWLNFEITESSEIAAKYASEQLLERLADIGIAISIDDFGSGYASFLYLKRFSIDFLKIDQQLIRHITQEEADVQIVRAIIAMAKALGIFAIAEGVEEDEQAERLQSMGCDFIQGYLFGRPVPADEFRRRHLLSAKMARTASGLIMH